MPRDLTSAVIDELTKGTVYPVLFCELEFDSGNVNVWSGYGEITWDSKTWSGVGDLGSVSPIRETANTEAVGVNLTLSGIPSAMLSVALGEHYQGRPASLWFGFTDKSGTIIADPANVYGGRMDIMKIDEGGETASITVSTESRLRDLRRARDHRYTHEDQQILYPGDLGLQFVASLQDQQIVWG